MIRKFLQRAHLEKSVIGKLYDRSVSPIVQHYRKSKKIKELQIHMQTYGIECLSLIYEICKRRNISVWLEFGSMLGAYRDHGFISFDYDIDISMYAEDFTPEFIRDLYDSGLIIRRLFKQIRNNDIDHKIVTEITLYYKDITIDVFLNYKADGNRILYVYKNFLGESYMKKNIYGVRRFALPISPIQEIDFMGIRIGIPANAKDCLSYYYGDNFMTPIKDWVRDTKDLDLSREEAYGEMIGAW